MVARRPDTTAARPHGVCAGSGNGGGRPPLRLVHASDVHLDTDYHGPGGDEGLRDRCRTVFAALLARVEALAPHLLLLPGDLFDSNRASHETVVWAMERLAALACPTVMIPGNHDCLEPEAVYRRYDFGALPGVTLLGDPAGERVHLPALDAVVWGRGMVAHTPDFQPLQGMPVPLAGRWNLGLGHGIFVGPDGLAGRSSPVRPEEIAASGYDYIALGHHHALRDVSAGDTTAWYAGAPVPIGPDDRGTFLSVALAEGEAPRVTVHTLD